MERILVTGGAGFIGSHIVDRLVKDGHEVRLLDNLEPQVHGRGCKRPRYLNPDAEFIQGDIRIREDVVKALDGIEFVFHLAAAVGIGQSMYEIERFTDVNCRGTGLLLEEAVKRKDIIRKLVVASSNTIYGEGTYRCEKCGTITPEFRGEAQLKEHDWEMKCGNCGNPATPTPTNEDKILAPTTVYAITKKTQEELALAVGKAYGMPSVALRCFNVYGPRQSLSNPYTGVAAIFQSNIKNDNPPVVYEDGLQSRDFVDVRDVVDAYILAMEDDRMDYQAYNVGSGKATTIADIAKTLTKLYGKDIKPDMPGKYRAGDIRHCTADISRIRKIGFEPRVSLRDGMKTLVEWGKKEDAKDMGGKALKELERTGLVRR